MMNVKRFVCISLLLFAFFAASPGFAAGKIDVNTATAVELTEINGVGSVLAQRIVEYRQVNGKFKSLDELEKVKGVGEKKLEKMKPLLTLSEG